MKTILYLLFLCLMFNVHGQIEWVLTDSLIDDNGELLGLYYESKDKSSNREVEFSDGHLSRISAFEGGWEIDSQCVYHHNGVLAACFYFKEQHYCSNFEVFDTSGVKFYEGAFWNSMRIGTWKAYDRQGNVISWVKYKYQYGDDEINQENAKTFTDKKEDYFKDTLLYDSETGRNFEYPWNGAVAGFKTWGIVEEVRPPQKLPLDNPNLYYHDGVVGWFPLSPYAVLNEFGRELPDNWEMGIYAGNPYNDTIGIAEVTMDAFNTDITSKKYMVGFYVNLFKPDDFAAVQSFYEGQVDYQVYEPGMKLKNGGYYYILKSRSYVIVIDAYPEIGKFSKVLTGFLPEYIELLEKWKDRW